MVEFKKLSEVDSQERIADGDTLLAVTDAGDIRKVGTEGLGGKINVDFTIEEGFEATAAANGDAFTITLDSINYADFDPSKYTFNGSDIESHIVEGPDFIADYGMPIEFKAPIFKDEPKTYNSLPIPTIVAFMYADDAGKLVLNLYWMAYNQMSCFAVDSYYHSKNVAAETKIWNQIFEYIEPSYTFNLSYTNGYKGIADFDFSDLSITSIWAVMVALHNGYTNIWSSNTDSWLCFDPADSYSGSAIAYCTDIWGRWYDQTSIYIYLPYTNFNMPSESTLEVTYWLYSSVLGYNLGTVNCEVGRLENITALTDNSITITCDEDVPDRIIIRQSSYSDNGIYNFSTNSWESNGNQIFTSAVRDGNKLTLSTNATNIDFPFDVYVAEEYNGFETGVQDIISNSGSSSSGSSSHYYCVKEVDEFEITNNGSGGTYGTVTLPYLAKELMPTLLYLQIGDGDIVPFEGRLDTYEGMWSREGNDYTTYNLNAHYGVPFWTEVYNTKKLSEILSSGTLSSDTKAISTENVVLKLYFTNLDISSLGTKNSAGNTVFKLRIYEFCGEEIQTK